MVETVLAHEKMPKAQARALARDTLGMVGIPSPEERLSAYPHQFSGGMRQRVAIAIALLHRPDLIIADEPTTALDVTIQGQILAKVQDLAETLGMSLIWITHDLGVVAGLAQRVAVMYAGRIVETGAIDEVLDRPAHPYTIGLMRAIPANVGRGEKLNPIPGMAPSPLARPAGCPFRNRCFAATDICASEPPLTEMRDGHAWRCFHPQLVEVA
jgi:peptide/nickel transport system ATP-binding protein